MEILFGQREHEKLPPNIEKLFENRENIIDEISAQLKKTAEKNQRIS